MVDIMPNFYHRTRHYRLPYWLGAGFCLSVVSIDADNLPTDIYEVTLSDPVVLPCESGACLYLSSAHSTATFEPCEPGAGGGINSITDDFDGDGNMDIVVAQPLANQGYGRITIRYGGDTVPAGSIPLCSDAAVIIAGDAAVDSLGGALAAGDITGDGTLDLFVGAVGAASGVGAVYIVPGGERWASLEHISDASDVITLLGTTGGEKLGASLATGDFTQDGNLDVIVGSPGASRVSLVAGPVPVGQTFTLDFGDNLVSFVGPSGGEAGFAVANLGDVDNNGYPDLGIGAPSANVGGGAAYLFASRSFSDFTSKGNSVILGQGASGGTAISHRTVNGDLKDRSNLVVGRLGHSVGGLGDLDGDGFSEIGLGAPSGYRTSTTSLLSGRCYLLFGGTSVLTSESSNTNLSSIPEYFYGETSSDNLGQWLVAAGDLDLDGYNDFLVSAHKGDEQSSENNIDGYGFVYLIPGRNRDEWPWTAASSSGSAISNDPVLRFSGQNIEDNAGTQVFSQPNFDLDQDGYAEFLVAVPAFDSSAGNDVGRIYYVDFGDFYDDDDDHQSESEGDCADSDSRRHYDSSGEAEVCDGVDNDCDGLIDSDDSFITDAFAYYPDQDNDGYGAEGDAEFFTCSSSFYEGYSSLTGDCNDASAVTYPTATDTCDGLDNNCDGSIDETIDADGDGSVGDSACSSQILDCNDSDASIYLGANEVCDSIDQDCDTNPVNGFDDDSDSFLDEEYCVGVTEPLDCDDANPLNYPGAVEVCDGIDNNCVDGTLEETQDVDGDSFTRCSVPFADCNDSSEGALIYPGADELCDGLDNNCDRYIPDDELDADGDKFAPCDDDCDDTDAEIFPDSSEYCDGKDNDCDDDIDEDALDGQEYYLDSDGDGYGDDVVKGCELQDGWSNQVGDCDDTEAQVYPGAEESCDLSDNDCDGETDELAQCGQFMSPTPDDDDGPYIGTDVGCACSQTPSSKPPTALLGLFVLVLGWQSVRRSTTNHGRAPKYAHRKNPVEKRIQLEPLRSSWLLLCLASSTASAAPLTPLVIEATTTTSVGNRSNMAVHLKAEPVMVGREDFETTLRWLAASDPGLACSQNATAWAEPLGKWPPEYAQTPPAGLYRAYLKLAQHTMLYLDFAKAIEALETARLALSCVDAPLTRDDVRELFLLEAAAQFYRRDPRYQEAFDALLVVDPRVFLEASYPPDLRKAFMDAAGRSSRVTARALEPNSSIETWIDGQNVLRIADLRPGYHVVQVKYLNIVKTSLVRIEAGTAPVRFDALVAFAFSARAPANLSAEIASGNLSAASNQAVRRLRDFYGAGLAYVILDGPTAEKVKIVGLDDQGKVSESSVIAPPTAFSSVAMPGLTATPEKRSIVTAEVGVGGSRTTRGRTAIGRGLVADVFVSRPMGRLLEPGILGRIYYRQLLGAEVPNLGYPAATIGPNVALRLKVSPHWQVSPTLGFLAGKQALIVASCRHSDDGYGDVLECGDEGTGNETAIVAIRGYGPAAAIFGSYI